MIFIFIIFYFIYFELKQWLFVILQDSAVSGVGTIQLDPEDPKSSIIGQGTRFTETVQVRMGHYKSNSVKYSMGIISLFPFNSLKAPLFPIGFIWIYIKLSIARMPACFDRLK